MTRSGLVGLEALSCLPGDAAARDCVHLLLCRACGRRAAYLLLKRHGGGIVRAAAADESSRQDATQVVVPAVSQAGGLFPELSTGRLLEASFRLQLDNPERAAQLAERAIRRARGGGRQNCGESPDEEARLLLTRATAMLGNAERLKESPWSVEELVVLLKERRQGDGAASLLRVVGLSFWERGWPAEAGRALTEAADAFGAAGDEIEESATRTLLGLLRVEQGLSRQGAKDLGAGLSLLPGWRSAWLAAQGTYGLAAALAEEGEEDAAANLYETGKRLCLKVRRNADLVGLYWAEARIEARIGRLSLAVDLLRSVAKKLSRVGQVGEAILAKAELMGLLVEGGGLAEAREVGSAEPDWLREAELLSADRSERAAAVRRLTWELRRQGPRPKPLPFA